MARYRHRPQANATSGLGVDRRTVEHSIYDVFMGDMPLDEVITPTSTPDLFVIPSSIDLAAVEIELVARYCAERLLANAVAHMEEKFDSVFLDCPPSLGLITVNALPQPTRS